MSKKKKELIRKCERAIEKAKYRENLQKYIEKFEFMISQLEEGRPIGFVEEIWIDYFLDRM